MISPANSAIDPVPWAPGRHDVRVPSYDVVHDRPGYVEVWHFDLHIHFGPWKKIIGPSFPDSPRGRTTSQIDPDEII